MCALGRAHPCNTSLASDPVSPLAHSVEDCLPSPHSKLVREAGGAGELLGLLTDPDPGEGLGFGSALCPDECEGRAALGSKKAARSSDAFTCDRGGTCGLGGFVDGRAQLSEEARHALGLHGSLPTGEDANASFGRRCVRLRRPQASPSLLTVQPCSQKLEEDESSAFEGRTPCGREPRR